MGKDTRDGPSWFHSRERGLWEKGATSGNLMTVVEARLDCDQDAILTEGEPGWPRMPHRRKVMLPQRSLPLRRGR